MIPAQVRSYVAAFGEEPLDYKDVDPNNPDHVARWRRWGKWKLSLVEAAWRHARASIESVDDGLLVFNQHMYGWYAYGDGYYWNVGRALPVLGGHGGYDGGAGYYPSWYYEMSYCRDRHKPAWYLPTFHGNLRSAHLRVEHYLSYILGARGVMIVRWGDDKQGGVPYTWDSTAGEPACTAALVESNKVLQKVGPVWDHVERARYPAGMLYSISNQLYCQARDMTDNYDGGPHKWALLMLYYASRRGQMPLEPVMDEDVLDGTLGAHFKALVVAGVTHIEPKVVAALEKYIAEGGAVFVDAGSKVAIRGARPLGRIDGSAIRSARAAGRTYTWDEILPDVRRVRGELREALASVGVEPVVESSEPGLFTTRAVGGDVEYLFTVNAAFDEQRSYGQFTRAAEAALAFPADGRPLYELVTGRLLADAAKAGQQPRLTLRYGPGQMRVFARPARPVGGVQVLSPTVRRDVTRPEAPIRLEVGAAVLDAEGRVLAGALPMRVRVLGPAGNCRHDVFRGAGRGTLELSVPLAANDPPGEWTVEAQELLSGKTARATFEYRPAAACPAIGASIRRAVYFGDDRRKVFRFAKTHRDVTVIHGTGEADRQAAERVAKVLEPWGVRCTLMPAEQANKPRPLAEEEALTWTGFHPGTHARMSPGTDNPIERMGFAVAGPTILVGTPEDNPLIAFAQRNGFLPYQAGEDFPGPGRGYLAWSRDNVSYGAECLVLIGYDAEGLAEAVGTMYEAAAGLEPLMEHDPAVGGEVAPAAPAKALAQPRVAWQHCLSDKAVDARALTDGRTAVLSADGTLTVLAKGGEVLWQRSFPAGELLHLDAAPDGSLLVVGATHHVLGFDGGGRALFDVPTAAGFEDHAGHRDRPVTAVAAAPNGKAAALATLDGSVRLLGADGRAVWSVGGVREADVAKFRAETAAWKRDVEPKLQAAQKAYAEGPAAEHNLAMYRWRIADPKTRGEQPKPPPPMEKFPAAPQPQRDAPVLQLHFSADGARLTAVRLSDVRVLDAADGRQLAEHGGVNGRAVWAVRAAAPQDALLLGDARSVCRLDLASLKMDRAAAPAGTVVLAPAGAHLLLGCENGFSVRRAAGFDRLGAEDADLWRFVLEGRLPKALAPLGQAAAVAYWGGTVLLLDDRGQPTAANLFDADVAAMVASDGRLVVALADGRVMALQAP